MQAGGPPRSFRARAQEVVADMRDIAPASRQARTLAASAASRLFILPQIGGPLLLIG
jgi:hypothetical protein